MRILYTSFIFLFPVYFCGYSYIHNTLFNIEELKIRKKNNTIISNTRNGTGDDVDVYFISTKSCRIGELGCHAPCQCSAVIRVVDFTAIIERKFPTVRKKFITWGVSNSSSIAVIYLSVSLFYHFPYYANCYCLVTCISWQHVAEKYAARNLFACSSLTLFARLPMIIMISCTSIFNIFNFFYYNSELKKC